MKKILCLCGLMMFHLICFAQEQNGWEEMFEEFYSNYQISQRDKEDYLELLTDLATHPIEINSATKEDLEQIPFLTEDQIEEILSYVYISHGMRTVNELAMIESLDYVRRQLLTYFIHIAPEDRKQTFPTLPTVVKKGQHSLLCTSHIPLYERAGDRNGYMGYPLSHSIRYTFKYADYVQAGLVGAQDAGEPFFKQRNKWGYDHYSMYVLIRKMGCVQSAVIGRYKINIGQGLIVNNSFGMGKATMLYAGARQGAVIRSNASKASDSYLQGGAITLRLAKQLDVTTFVSYRGIDATLTDSGAVQTIIKTGYHRTEKEMGKRNAVNQLIGGFNVAWKYKTLHIGITGLYNHFDKTLKPRENVYYQKYNPQGNDFLNVGVDFVFIKPKWAFAGEIGADKKGHIAMVNNLSYQPWRSLMVYSIQRYYSYKYNAILSKGFSEGGRIQNESGLLVGAVWNGIRNVAIQAYSDLVYFSHPRYRAHFGSRAWDTLLAMTYSLNKWNFNGRYRIKLRGRDNEKKTGLINDVTQRMRISGKFDGGKWQNKCQMDMVMSRYTKQSFGWMVSDNVDWKYQKWLLSGNVGYFQTTSGNAKLYVYERGPLYSFGFPSYSGKGLRFGIYARYDINKKIMVLAKYGGTKYFDRKTISTGLQKVEASMLNDLYVQIRLKW